MKQHSSEPLHTRPALRRVFLLMAITIISLGGSAFAQLTAPTFGLDVSDIPGADAFTNPAFLDCLTSPDPVACASSRLSGSAPDATHEDQAVLSLIESDYGNPLDLGLPPAIEMLFSSVLSTPPAIHLAHRGEYEKCAEEVQNEGIAFSECGYTWQPSFPSIAAPQENYEAYEKDVIQIWDRFNTNVVNDIHRALNDGVPCMNPPRVVCSLLWITGPVVPVPDPVCVAAKLATAWPAAFAKHYPQMWAEIVEATVKHLPNTVAFGLSFTNPLDPLRGGSLIAPIADVSVENLFEGFTLDSIGVPLDLADLTDPSAIASLDSDARQNLYYHEALITMLTGLVMNTPVLPHEHNPNTLGIEAFEQAKAALTANTGLMYESLGYALFSQLRAPQTTHLFHTRGFRIPFYKPSLEVKCLEGGIPTGAHYPIPVIQPVAKPAVRLISIEEGGIIPSTAGPMITIF